MDSTLSSDRERQWETYRTIKEVHENSRGVFPKAREPGKMGNAPFVFDGESLTLYSSDFAPKSVKPIEQRPCSVTRRNNPHPSQMFMHWKVPTRLIKDKPEYRAQQQSLIKDSHQHFYEDINGKRQFTNVENDVLKYTDEMYKNAGGWKEPTKHVRSSMTSTTHHSPPYHMFPQSRGKDYVSQSAVLPRGTVNPGRATHSAGSVRALPSISGTPPNNKLERKVAVPDIRNSTLQRSLKPRAQPAAEKWLRVAPDSDKKIIDQVLRITDKEYVEKTLTHALQPDAKKAVEKWMDNASDRDRDVAVQFFSSLAGSRLMGAKEGVKHEDDSQCKICDGDRLRQVLDTLNKGRTGSYVLARETGAINPAKRNAHLRLLTPTTRATKPQHQTWHHLPVIRHPGPVSNTISMFTRPHRAIPRHFTIHPEWE